MLDALNIDGDGAAVLQLDDVSVYVGVVVLGQGALEQAGPALLQGGGSIFALRYSIFLTIRSFERIFF